MTLSPDLPELATESREDAFRRLAFLAEASALLASTLEPKSVLDRIAELLVPTWADWCLIDLVRDHDTMERVSVAHADPAQSELAAIMRKHAPAPEQHPARRAIRGNEGVLHELVTEEVLVSAAHDEEHLDAMRRVLPHSLLAVPLIVRGRTIGSLTLITSGSLRTYGSEDLDFAREIGRRAALAVDNASLFADVQHAELRYRSLVESIDGIVFEADVDPFRIRFVSERAEQILGYPVARWLADPDLGSATIHPDDAPTVTDLFRAALTRGESGELDYRIRHADGGWRWMRVAIAAERDPSGAVSAIRGLASEVTARKTNELYERAQAAADHVLANAEHADDLPTDLLRSICETLGWRYAALWEVDEHASTLHFVSEWAEDPETTRAFSELCASMRFEPGVGLPGRVWRSAEPAWIVELSEDPNFPRASTAKDVGLRSGIGFPIISAGRVLGVMEFFAREPATPDDDLLALMATIGTQVGQFFERKRAEDALRLSEARTRAVLASAMDGVITIDKDGRIIEFNQAAERMFGYDVVDVIGKEMADLIVPPNQREGHRRGVARYLATGEGRVLNKRLEFEAMRADRTLFPVELTITRVDAPGDPIFTGYIRDITERTTAERLRDAQHAITRELAHAPSLEAAAPRVLEAICASKGWELGILWEVRRRPNGLRVAGTWWSPNAGVEAEHFAERARATTLAKGEGLAGRVWETGRASWSAEREGITPQPADALVGLRAAMGFPILAGGHVLGVLDFFSHREETPDTELIGMLENVGTQIAQFIVRRAAEDETRFQKALLQSQNEATIDGILITSPEGDIVSFNKRFSELFAIPDDVANAEDARAIGDHVLEQVVDRAGFVARATELFRQADGSDREEMALTDGRILDRYTAPLRSEDGQLLGRAWYYRDITDRKRTEAALAANNQRFAFLAEASTVLGGSLDMDQTMQTLTQISVPYLADACVVDVLEHDGSVRQVALHAADPVKKQMIERRLAEGRHLDIDPDAPRGVPRVLRTGRSEMAAVIEEEWLVDAAAGDTEYLERIRSFGFRSYMCVPLTARTQILGAITFLTAESGRHYGPADLALAEDLARRAALAVDNARLFTERENVARTLQESLLPPSLPDIPGCEVGAAFHYAGKGTEVGGDFYDLFDTGDDEWALVIGDVCGKGAAAAAITALARYTIRAAAIQARKPNRVLSILNDAILRQSSERFATVAYARLSGTTGDTRRLTVACGGHPPPLILRANGRVEPIGIPGGLLGVFVDASLTDSSTTLERGDALVLYTDGVIEARNDRETLGDEGLRALLEECRGRGAIEIAQHVGRSAIELQAGSPRDDIAVLVIRVI